MFSGHRLVPLELFLSWTLSTKFSIVADRLCALFLLKHCFSIPRFLFTLRTSPTFTFTDSLRQLDECVRSAFVDVVNLKVDSSQWLQATLPQKLGGMGIGSVQALCTSAFISSVTSTASLSSAILGSAAHLQHPYLAGAIEVWKESTGREPPTSQPLSHSQAIWSTEVFRSLRTRLLNDLDERGRGRVLGCSAPGSADWLSAIPSTKMGLHLNDSQLRIAVGLRLGAPVSYQHQCVCGSPADVFGTHALSCSKSKSRHARHASLNHIIKRALQAAGVPALLEPVGLVRSDGKRPDGMSVVPWRSGKCLLWDATCVNRLANSYARAAVTDGPAVALMAESRKESKYASLLEEYAFYPVAIESLGGFGRQAWRLVREIGRMTSNKTAEPKEAFYLRQRLAVAIQMGNAACVLESAACGDSEFY